MAKIKKVFRMTISDMQILGTIEVLTHYRSIYGLNTDALELLTKFQKEAIEINNGTDTPAYIATGVKRESSINLDSLGANVPMPTQVKYNNSAELSDEQGDELERLERAMLEELAAAGNKNVILAPLEPVPDTSGATQFIKDEFGNILSPDNVDKNKDMYDNLFGKL